MTKTPPFPGFDGLMTLSRRDGVDIRPTLLRVLTDLYVQAHSHSADEALQFTELSSRLIDQVDDATRAAVRARLSIYPGTPEEVLRKLDSQQAGPEPRISFAPSHAPELPELPRESAPSTAPASAPARPVSDVEQRIASNLTMQQTDAAEICEMFFSAAGGERFAILQNLAATPLKAAPRVFEKRAARSIEALEMAAFAVDIENFTIELAETLILPARLAAQIVDDPGGEPLACAMRALGMPGPVFERVLLFLKPEFGTSVKLVYRLSRLYDRLSERSALVMLAAWRGSTMAVPRAKYRPGLYDDERQRARLTGTSTRPTAHQDATPHVRTGASGTGR